MNAHITESDALRSLRKTPEELRMSAPNADELTNMTNFYTSTTTRLSNLEGKINQLCNLLQNHQDQIDLIREFCQQVQDELEQGDSTESHVV